MTIEQFLNEDNIHSEVETRVRDFSELTSIQVSPKAQDLLVAVLGAFLWDPHPSWRVEEESHLKYAGIYLNNIPLYLQQMASRGQNRPGDQTISSFDVLRWLSENLGSICVYVCPFG